jgi:hypothetical protein
VFFRPEEEGLSSIIINDIRAFESPPIDIRPKKQWFGVFFPYLGIQFAVHGDVKYLPAMGALALEFNGKLFSPEAPLHEGRSESIFCSSAMGAFSSAELQAMRSGARS